MRCTMNLMRLFPRWQVTEHSQLTVVKGKILTVKIEAPTEDIIKYLKSRLSQ